VKILAPAFLLFLILSFITGLIYPLTVTSIAQLFFADKANGSLLKKDTIVVGSELVAQKFTGQQYFWPRPSSGDYQTLPSAASNLGLSAKSLKDRIENKKKEGWVGHGEEEMLFTSGSGLDPHISPNSAVSQAPRMANVRKVDKNEIIQLVQRHIEERQFYILGQPRVNVLKLNVDLDKEFGLGH
jgi:potassium-transporting ATPase KdpC subunit